MTDHKPLRVHATFRKGVTPETETNVISQFITRMEYLSGNDNISRIEAIRLPAEIELNELTQQQEQDEELRYICDSPEFPLIMKQIQWGPTHTTLYCEMTGEAICPYIPASLRNRFFRMFHDAAHPGPKVTDRIIRQR